MYNAFKNKTPLLQCQLKLTIRQIRLFHNNIKCGLYAFYNKSNRANIAKLT